MDNNQTVEKLKQMRLKAMASYHLQSVANNRLSDTTPDEYLAMITDHEWEHRQNNKIARFTYQAGFRQEASIESINYTALRNLDKNMFQRLANLSFVQKKENIIITGASGVGKSYIAQALGRQACLLQIPDYTDPLIRTQCYSNININGLTFRRMLTPLNGKTY